MKTILLYLSVLATPAVFASSEKVQFKVDLHLNRCILDADGADHACEGTPSLITETVAVDLKMGHCQGGQGLYAHGLQ